MVLPLLTFTNALQPSPSARRPSEAALGQHMKVQVLHALAAVFPHIGDHPVSLFTAQLVAQPRDGGKHMGQQRSVLFKGSIRDNMKWGNENASDSEIWDALKVAQAKEVVEGKDGQLDFMLEQNGKNLSGGQRQRLTIARALVKKPEILILDDSLSALDFATDAALRKALAGLEGETTTFLVSQRVAGIRQADKILVLDNGELAGSGTHDELMKSCEVYREIYFSQFPEDRAKYERGEM